MSFVIDLSDMVASAKRANRFPRRLLAIAIGPLTVVGILLVGVLLTKLRTERRARRDNSLDQISSQISHQIASWRALTRVIALASDLQPADAARAQRYATELLARFPDITLISVTDDRGNRIAEARRPGVLTEPAVSLQGEALRRHIEGAGLWIAPVHVQNEGRPRLPFFSTIRREGRTLGFLLVEFRTDAIATLLQGAPFPMTLSEGRALIASSSVFSQGSVIAAETFADAPAGFRRTIEDGGWSLILARKPAAARSTFLLTAVLLLSLGALVGGVAYAEIRWSKRAAADIAHRERLIAIGATASAVGHEIRTALAVIRNAISVLKTRADLSDPRASKHVEAIEGQVRLANRVLADLLEFARPKGPLLKLDHVNPFVHDVLGGLDIPRSIRVRTLLPNDLPRIALDGDKIKQALSNLILNAVEAMPEGGMITIETRALASFVFVEVRDTGPGIDPETRDRIFEPFFTTKPRGMGLGLAIVKKIVDAHYGDIAVDSESGEGAAFRLRFPAEVPNATALGPDAEVTASA